MNKTAMFLQKEKKKWNGKKRSQHFKATMGKDCFMPPLFTNI